MTSPLVEPDPAAFTPTPVSEEGPVVEPEPAPVQETPAFPPPPKRRRECVGRPERPEHPGRTSRRPPRNPEAIPAPRRRSRWPDHRGAQAAPAQADQQPQPAPGRAAGEHRGGPGCPPPGGAGPAGGEPRIPTLTQGSWKSLPSPWRKWPSRRSPRPKPPRRPPPRRSPSSRPLPPNPRWSRRSPPGGGPGPTSTEEPTIHIGGDPHPGPLAGGRAGEARGRELCRRHR